MGAGDFDLFASPDDGKAYMAFERVHTEMIVADLSDDYTAFTGHYSTHWPNARPPDTRVLTVPKEGVAYLDNRTAPYLDGLARRIEPDIAGLEFPRPHAGDCAS
jgi:hypothetical protein